MAFGSWTCRYSYSESEYLDLVSCLHFLALCSYLAEYPIESINSSNRALSFSCNSLGFLFRLDVSMLAVIVRESQRNCWNLVLDPARPKCKPLFLKRVPGEKKEKATCWPQANEGVVLLNRVEEST